MRQPVITTSRRGFARIAVCLTTLAAQAGVAQAETVEYRLLDEQGRPVPEAVLEWEPLTAAEPVPARDAIMDQVNRQFSPVVLAIPLGSSVSFPNNDNIRHHVYSFSPAKAFELKLYADTPGEPLVFDQPGVVVLGCNIHDNMVGYIYVGQHFASSDEQGRLQAPAPEDWQQAWVWHPRLSPDGHQRLPLSDKLLPSQADGTWQIRLPLTLPVEKTDSVPPKNRFNRFVQ